MSLLVNVHSSVGIEMESAAYPKNSLYAFIRHVEHREGWVFSATGQEINCDYPGAGFRIKCLIII